MPSGGRGTAGAFDGSTTVFLAFRCCRLYLERSLLVQRAFRLLVTLLVDAGVEGAIEVSVLIVSSSSVVPAIESYSSLISIPNESCSKSLDDDGDSDVIGGGCGCGCGVDDTGGCDSLSLNLSLGPG